MARGTHSWLLKHSNKRGAGSSSFGSLLGGEGSEELVLLGEGLEATVTVFGGGIDELNLNVLGLPGLGGGEDRLTDDNGSLLDTDDTALDEEEILLDLTVVGEATHGSDVLGDSISLSGSVVVNTTDLTSTNAVDLLVDLGSAMVTQLTTSGDRPFDGGGMPGTDTSDLSETSMRLSGESGHTESLDDTACSLTLGHSNSVNALVVGEDLTNGELLLELLVSEVNLLGDASTVKLDLHDVGLVLSEVELADLGGGEDTDDSAVLLDSLKVSLDGAFALVVFLEAVSVLGEGLLLGVHPVLVETSLDVVIELGGPHGVKCAHATGGLDVTDQTDDLHRRALNNGGGVNDVLLDDLLSFTTLLVLDDVSHTGLVTHEGGEVDGLGSIVSGEMSDSTVMMLCAALGQIGKGPLSGVLKLSVGHGRVVFSSYLIIIIH